jgi:DNA-binding CsgD family transcriptional regulator
MLARKSSAPPIPLIAHDLGISEREAEIAALLVAVNDLKGIAARLNISIHTARTQLKTVFGKTGIRSQAELIQRIARVPAAFFGQGVD